MYNSVFFELYIYNSIFFELYMYNSVFFVRYIPIYISIHSTFSLFLNLPLGKRLHFSPFHGWVLKCIFFQAALVWNQNCNFGKPAGSLLAVLVLPAALLAHLELLSIIAVLVIIFALILHTLHWLQDFVRRRARCGHSRSLKGIIQMWSNEPQCFKAILCQEIAFQQIFSHAFQKHPVNKTIKKRKNWLSFEHANKLSLLS